MKIVDGPLTRGELKTMAESTFGNLIKAVVDVDRGLLALDAELHSDLEALLLANGSSLKSLWGINLYPEMPGDAIVEFDSMINMRPSQGNRSRGIDDAQIRRRISDIIAVKVKP